MHATIVFVSRNGYLLSKRLSYLPISDCALDKLISSLLCKDDLDDVLDATASFD